MSGTDQRRKLSNVKLTREYRYRHLRKWILLTMAMVVLFNVMLHLLIRERWHTFGLSAGDIGADYALVAGPLLLAQAIESALFGGAIVVLAMFTSHRIAGPYVRLRRVFDEVRDGNLDCRLRFRRYDHLTEVESAFNAMMESIARAAAAGPKDKEFRAEGGART